MGSTIPKDPDVGKPVTRGYRERYEWTSQFQGAEMIATSGASRARTVTSSQAVAGPRAKARANGCFESQILPIEAPVPDDAGAPAETGRRRRGAA